MQNNISTTSASEGPRFRKNAFMVPYRWLPPGLCLGASGSNRRQQSPVVALALVGVRDCERSQVHGACGRYFQGSW